MKDSGVSPVIATILMVAITVVLAAVLYVMVTGFTHSPGTANSAGLSASQNSANNWTLSISSVSSATIQLSNLKLVVNGTGIPLSGSTFIAGGTVKVTSGSYTVYFTVITGNSAKYLQSGDYFYVTSTSATNVVTAGITVTLYDGSSSLASTTL